MNKWLNSGLFVAFIILIVDVLSFFGIVKFVHEIRLEHQYSIAIIPLMGILAIIIVSLYAFNTYQLYKRPKAATIAMRAFSAIFCAGVLLAAFIYTTKTTDSTTVFWRGNLPATLFSYAMWVMVFRFFTIKIYNKNSRPIHWVFINPDPHSESIIEDQRAHKPHEKVSILDSSDALSELLNSKRLHGEGVNGIILCESKTVSAIQIQDLMHTRLSGISVYTLEAFSEINLSKIPVLNLGQSFFVFSNGFSLVHHDIALKVKRLIDITLSLTAMLLLFPLIAFIALLNKILEPSAKAFYSQQRCGQHQAPFTIYKFRTMIENAEINGAQWSQENDPRITKFGKFLRQTRIDELPQLWNVLKGEMSFIGPRPERPEFVEMLEAEIPYYDIRHIIKPGLTGWAQVMYPYGRSKLDAIHKLEYDLYYIKNYSISLDAYILFKTLKIMVRKMGS